MTGGIHEGISTSPVKLARRSCSKGSEVSIRRAWQKVEVAVSGQDLGAYRKPKNKRDRQCGCPMPVAHELESSPLARVGIVFSHFSQLSTRYSTKSFEESIIVFLRRFLAGLEARVSGGIRSRDVVLQVFDSFFLLRDNPLHKVTD